MRATILLLLACVPCTLADAKKEARAKEIRKELADLKDRLAKLEKELATLEAGKSFAGAYFYIDDFKIGDKGVPFYNEKTHRRRGEILCSVFTIIDDNTLQVINRFAEPRHFLLIMPTKGLVDDLEFTMDFPVHVSGTRTINGRTYYVMVRIP